MICRGQAIRFDKRTDVGRTEPLRTLITITDDEIEHDVIMKISQSLGGSVNNLAYEMLGAILAGDLGLPVCRPFLVEMDDAFVGSIFPLSLRQRLETSCPLAFGSQDAGRQWRTWSAGTDHVSAEQVDLALRIIAFDAFTGNPDRAPNNPNMLVQGDQWRLIDHENAFGFRLKLFPKCQPWVIGNLDLLTKWGQWSEHIFAQTLHKKSNLDFSSVRNSWADLSDVRLAEYDACLPPEWDDARDDFSDAINHIRQVRDTIDLCVAELKRVLT